MNQKTTPKPTNHNTYRRRKRPRDTYKAKTEEAYQAQIDALDEGRTRRWNRHREMQRAKAASDPKRDPFDPIYQDDICLFLEDQFYIPETRKPITLEDWQREEILEPLFEKDPSTGLRRYTLALIGLPKKNGKTALAAGIVLYFLFHDEEYGELIITANSREQSSWLTWDKLKKAINLNRNMDAYLTVKEDAIINRANGTTVRIVAPNYKTSAGGNPNLTCFDELWAYEDTPTMSARKFYDELTTVPTRKQPLTLITTYAGFDDEGLLWELYQKGEKGNDPQTFFYWTHENKASWITPAYLATQKTRLRPNTYLRLHENRWTSSESAFIDLEDWDACIDLNHHPSLPNRNLSITVGVDVSVSGDSTAVVATACIGNRVALIKHRKWQPSKKEKMDFEESVEAFILGLDRDFSISECLYDPYQFHRSATTLAKKGVRMTEYPQTVDRLTAMGQNLYDLITGGNMILYKSKEMRQHASKAVAKEHQRGWQIIKKKSSHKIDLIIALAMSALGSAQKMGETGPRIRMIGGDPRNENEEIDAEQLQRHEEAKQQAIDDWYSGEEEDNNGLLPYRRHIIR